MSKPVTLDLNIGRYCLDNWSNYHAIRELIANGIDAHLMKNINKKIEITEYKGGRVEIIDYGKGISKKSFIHQTNPTKKGDLSYIGQFGIGLKDALGVLCKNNVDVTILTQSYKFIPMYKEKEDTTEETLHIIVTKNKENKENNDNDDEDDEDEDNKYGTKIILRKLGKDDLKKAKNYFLDYADKKAEILYKSSPELILYNDKKQAIYVNNMKTCKTSNLLFSYNIKKTEEIAKEFNRDSEDKNYEMFNIAEKFLGIIMDKEYQLHIIELH